MAEAKSKELEVRQASDIEALNELEEILRGNQTVEGVEVSDDPAAAQARILEQLLNATDDDELEAVGKSTPWNTLLGVPMQINGWRWRPSEVEGDGPPIYAIVDVTNVQTGDTLSVTIGSWGVLAQLINLQKRDKIPGAVRILEKGEATKGGFHPLRLVSTERERDERAQAKIKERM